MISSMTGYGRGEATDGRMTVMVELRSVNSRFCEVSSRLPRTLLPFENEMKERIKAELGRGKITLSAQTDYAQPVGSAPLRVDPDLARGYHQLLEDLRAATGIAEPVGLSHLLTFRDVFQPVEATEASQAEYRIFNQALGEALTAMQTMRGLEGEELRRDLTERIEGTSRSIDEIEALAAGRVPAHRDRLRARIQELLPDGVPLNTDRLEQELAMLAERLDISEEFVRYRSHVKFFLQTLNGPEDAVGRKLNFLLQEMNREVNTMGSKAQEPHIAHVVVGVKEALEQVREQIQNLE